MGRKQLSTSQLTHRLLKTRIRLPLAAERHSPDHCSYPNPESEFTGGERGAATP